MRPPAAASFYAQPQQLPVDYDYKQQSSGAYINNYVPMMSSIASNFVHHHHQQQQQPQPQQLHPPPPPTTPQGGPNQVQSQHGAGIPLPILVHQQPSGQIQYLFPAHPLHQQLQPPPPNAYPLTPDPQYVQVNVHNNVAYITKKDFLFFPPKSFIDQIRYPYRVHLQYHHRHQLLMLITPIIIHILKISLVIVTQFLNNNHRNSNSKSHQLSQILFRSHRLFFEYIQQEHKVMFHIHLLLRLISHLHQHQHLKQHSYNQVTEQRQIHYFRKTILVI